MVKTAKERESGMVQQQSMKDIPFTVREHARLLSSTAASYSPEDLISRDEFKQGKRRIA
jgi:hypothetical protein